MKRFSIALFVAVLSLTGCKKASERIIPVDLPADVGVKDYQFPEDSAKIYDWLDDENDAAIAQHAWGIWAGLTKQTGQKFDGQELYVFETWNGVSELSDASSSGNRNAGCGFSRTSRNMLQKPKQFVHAGLLGATEPSTDYSILETVAYSPAASCFVTSNLLFNKTSLETFRVKGGIGKIPSFPVTSITTKPTYYVTRSQSGLVRVPAWTNTPEPAKEYPNTQWGNWVYVDLDNKQEPGKKLVPVNTDTPTPEQIAAATCNRSDFISFTIDEATADYLNVRQDKGKSPDEKFHAGSTALLVAMHVTTKEIDNWTWQTYFWVPDPKNPGAPSSKSIADLMPSVVTGAASHYAASVAYAMVYPNQPITGGSNLGARPIIAYNPYLEAGFGPGVFKHPNEWQPDFKYGVQTNCASCHALATYGRDLGYSTDQYIDMRDHVFDDTVQLDFAWSIAGNLNETH